MFRAEVGCQCLDNLIIREVHDGSCPHGVPTQLSQEVRGALDLCPSSQLSNGLELSQEVREILLSIIQKEGHICRSRLDAGVLGLLSFADLFLEFYFARMSSAIIYRFLELARRSWKICG